MKSEKKGYEESCGDDSKEYEIHEEIDKSVNMNRTKSADMIVNKYMEVLRVE